jgi:pantetheine-phosphate adenylyltransferase
MFDTVVVGVAKNPGKSPLLTVEQRVNLIREVFAEDPGVTADIIPGLVVDYCHEVGAHSIFKGLRGGADLDAELPMALMNRHMGVETVFVIADPEFAHIASSFVKEIALHGGPIDDLVPEPVAAVIHAALAPTHSSTPDTTAEGQS